MKSPLSLLRAAGALLGVERNTTSHAEKLIATTGALLGILLVSLVSLWFAPGTAATLLIASTGASAVLLFVVPHGALSQPWPVLAGHLLSALIGVACRQWLPDQLWTPAVAVCLAIAAMQYLRCVHPPGGATALAAVTGGEQVAALGFGFVVTPVLLNVLCLLALALLFNNLFPWRRYPAHLMQRSFAPARAAARERPELTQEDFEAALQQLDTFIDVSTEDLVELVELARQHAERHHTHPDRIEPGRSYSNGRLGRHWSVRQVLDAGGREGKGKLIYKTMAGQDAWDTGICSQQEFLHWACFEVVCRDGRWIRACELEPPRIQRDAA